MLSKPMRCTKNCNACSRHWSTKWAQFFSTAMPDYTSHDQRFKSWMIWAVKFCLLCHFHLPSHQLIAMSSSICTKFCRENTSTIIRKQEIISTDLYATEIKFLIGKNVLIVMVPISINSGVFEPSYNDLRFMVWNRNYLFSSLIILSNQDFQVKVINIILYCSK